MSVDIKNWSEHDSLEFTDQRIEWVNLLLATKNQGPDRVLFNTELRFHNCEIGAFSADTLVLRKKVSFINCRIGFLSCFATQFHGGLLIEDCVIEQESSFNAGVHNQDPHAFEITRSRFDGYVDFFDVWFLGPVKITDNSFNQGTNLEVYLKVPFGIAAELPCDTSGNTGDLLKQKEDEPKIMRG